MSETFICPSCQIVTSISDFENHYWNVCSGKLIVHQCLIENCMQLFTTHQALLEHGKEAHPDLIFFEEAYVMVDEQIANSLRQEIWNKSAKIVPIKFQLEEFLEPFVNEDENNNLNYVDNFFLVNKETYSKYPPISAIQEKSSDEQIHHQILSLVREVDSCCPEIEADESKIAESKNSVSENIEKNPVTNSVGQNFKSYNDCSSSRMVIPNKIETGLLPEIKDENLSNGRVHHQVDSSYPEIKIESEIVEIRNCESENTEKTVITNPDGQNVKSYVSNENNFSSSTMDISNKIETGISTEIKDEDLSKVDSLCPEITTDDSEITEIKKCETVNPDGQNLGICVKNENDCSSSPMIISDEIEIKSEDKSNLKEDNVLKACPIDKRHEKIFVCSYEGCKITFAKKSSKCRHEVRVHNLPIRCSYENCGELVRADGFRDHLNQVHDKLKREIQQNFFKRYETRSRNEKQEPKNTHDKTDQKISRQKTRKFSCSHEKCSAVFTEKYRLTKHLKTVHQPASKCPYENCNSFFKPKNLKRHVNDLHKKVEECQICKKWILSRSFQKHRKICNKSEILLKLYLCPHEGCDASFKIKNHRNRHLKRVHVLPIKCTYKNCSAVMKPCSLSRHIKNCHKKMKK